MILRRTVRPALAAQPVTSFNNGQPRWIVFKHPGYSDYAKQNDLLRLYATDCIDGGLHYGTAWLACAIIAGNAWDGYLTKEREGMRIDMQEDDLLMGESYYFHVPLAAQDVEKNIPYPIYPSFQQWSFPHSHLPPAWDGMLQAQRQTAEERNETILTPAASAWSAAVVSRDKECIVTGQRDCCMASHVIPRSELDWFNKNGMSEYNLNAILSESNVIDDLSNAVSLRGDIHKAFDDRKFSPVPKEGQWLVHFLPPTNDLGNLYHNTPIAVPAGVSVMSLFARFAWAIFPSAKLIESGHRRLLRLQVVKDGEGVEVVRNLNASEYRLATQPQSRSSSPRKRPATLIEGPADSVQSKDEKTHKRMRSSESPNGPGADDKAQGITAKRQKLNEPESMPSAPSFQPCSQIDTYSSNHEMPMTRIDLTRHRDVFNTKIEDPLCTVTTTSRRSPSVNAQTQSRQLKAIKRALLVAQRPTNPDLYCCDYRTAENDALSGRPGREEFDGAYLCPECLGFEYLN